MIVQEVNDWRGICVSMGLSTPACRAFTAFALVSSIGYMTGTPKGAFTPAGEMRPWSALSHDPDATANPLFLTPTLLAGAVYLFT